MVAKSNFIAVGSFLLFLLAGQACMLFGDGTGACVSDAVEYSFGLRVYCYSDFDKKECDSHNRNQVNGADWSFHEGQTCGDRDLDEGSNPWP